MLIRPLTFLYISGQTISNSYKIEFNNYLFRSATNCSTRCCTLFKQEPHIVPAFVFSWTSLRVFAPDSTGKYSEIIFLIEMVSNVLSMKNSTKIWKCKQHIKPHYICEHFLLLQESIIKFFCFKLSIPFHDRNLEVDAYQRKQ